MSASSDDIEQDRLVISDSGKDGKEQVRNLDDFITLGWYCTTVLLAAEFMTMSALSSMVYMVYAGVRPTVVSCGPVHFNNSHEACERLSELMATTSCTPELEYQFKSVNVEFGLLCEDGKLVKGSISVQMISVLFGALISGQLSDRYGRKKILLVALIGVGVFSAANAMAMTFLQFTILRGITGFFTGCLTSVQGVFLVENIPKRHRMWINTIVTWSPNFIVYPAVAYVCRDWRALALFSTFAAFVSVVNLLFLHESPRWLIHHGRIEEARRIMSDIRRKNGKTCEKEATEIEQMLLREQEAFEAKQKKTKHYTFYHLVCTWKYLRWTVTICSGLIVASLVNYGLLFNMEKLSGSLFWNNTLFGILRWGVNIVVGVSDYFCHCFGRKLVNLISISSIISALGMICIIYIADYQAEGAWIIRYGTIAVTSMTSQLYIAKFMITNELFPTAVRNIAVSALGVSSRLGTILAPQIFELSEILPVLPYAVLLVLAVVDCICFQIFLPETKGKSLENHLPPKEKRILNRKRTVLDE